MSEPVVANSSMDTVIESRSEEPVEATTATKRRQSNSPEPSTKRARISDAGNDGSGSPTHPDRRPSIASPPPKSQETIRERTQSDAQEERRRGRRLFGGLLNTLSQSASNPQQKKRLEIEKRQHEKARLQKAEDESRRAERLEKLREIRLREQVKFDEQSMRMRHSNVLAMAHFLSTKTEPKLYYKPWKLLPEEEDRIKDQIAETEMLIEREVQDFRQRHNIPREKDDVPMAEDGDSQNHKIDNDNDRAEETVGEHLAESTPEAPPAANDTTNPPPTTTLPAAEDQGGSKTSPERDLQDDSGEVIVEGDEDTVIY